MTNENCELCNKVIVIEYNNNDKRTIVNDFTEFLGNYICKACIETIIKEYIVTQRTRGNGKYKSRIKGYTIKSFNWRKGGKFT